MRGSGSDLVVILILVVFGIGVFTLSFWLLQRKSFVYIDDILHAIKKISSGDLNTNIDVRGDNEFSEIAANINKMSEEIRVLMESERHNEKSKNEMITNIAHDLRTPLTSILGYLDLINKRELTEDTKKEYLKIVYEKSKKLQDLIESLFSFTKTNSSKLVLKIDKIDIIKLLCQLMEEFYPNFEDKGITCSVNTNIDSYVIDGDGTLLARLFDNLINNAVKYGADGKRIDVKIIAENNIVKIAVINYGKVIPQDELPLIFDKFYRVDQARNSGTGGTGLGLAIAKNITELHHGVIEVTSDLGGTVFSVTLPKELDVERENFKKLE
ncbi:HAMP domain / histidine kinase A domain / GHKL domain multi-domain protein [Lachnoanaerobaculum saburreum F0468]|uniref:histidine kinase n=1 Tax=Lachnoanaerobaculum saburreum F0468 TaxID=1095750 RepID=I0R9Y0_9FIRM|nr:HAMP domain / histidine kinase A domain / GHKL domain multi-domain protein [Lachnoanaerobaculum saburreum F0468]